MTTPKSFQREVPCHVLTLAGWIEGTLHVSDRAYLLDYLNRGEPIFRMTAVILPGGFPPQRFFAVERNAVIAVVPLARDELLEAPPVSPVEEHRLAWLLPGGAVIVGSIDLLQGIRVSDHLLHHSGFLPMHACTIYQQSEGAEPVVDRGVANLAIQSSLAVGVSEGRPRTER